MPVLTMPLALFIWTPTDLVGLLFWGSIVGYLAFKLAKATVINWWRRK